MESKSVILKGLNVRIIAISCVKNLIKWQSKIVSMSLIHALI
jgi:hypothetical protein